MSVCAPWIMRTDTADTVAAGRRKALHSAVLSMPPLMLTTPAQSEELELKATLSSQSSHAAAPASERSTV